MKYRKKPVVIDAFCWNVDEEPDWFKEAVKKRIITIHRGKDLFLQIRTLDSVAFAEAGDYVVRGTKGEFYPCRADVFEETYELVLD